MATRLPVAIRLDLFLYLVLHHKYPSFSHSSLNGFILQLQTNNPVLVNQWISFADMFYFRQSKHFTVLQFSRSLYYLTAEGNGNPLQYSCLENPRDGRAWWAAVHGVAESWTRLNNFTFTFHFRALGKEMAIHSSVVAWRIPGTGEPGGLPSMGSHRVGHDWSDAAAAAAAAIILQIVNISDRPEPWRGIVWQCIRNCD